MESRLITSAAPTILKLLLPDTILNWSSKSIQLIYALGMPDVVGKLSCTQCVNDDKTPDEPVMLPGEIPLPVAAIAPAPANVAKRSLTMMLLPLPGELPLLCQKLLANTVTASPVITFNVVPKPTVFPALPS